MTPPKCQCATHVRKPPSPSPRLVRSHSMPWLRRPRHNSRRRQYRYYDDTDVAQASHSTSSSTSSTSSLNSQWSTREDDKIHCQTVCASVLQVDIHDLHHPTKKGTTFNHILARAHDGRDTRQLCVLKWPREKHVVYCLYNHIELPVHVGHRVCYLLSKFYSVVRRSTPWIILMNQPRPVDMHGEQRLVEPFVHNWHKFNSNAGYAASSTQSFNLLVQAFSHFSYHASHGEYIVCNAKGGVNFKQKKVILCNPVIATRGSGDVFGCTDNGETAIDSFFDNHKCNHFCKLFLKGNGHGNSEGRRRKQTVSKRERKDRPNDREKAQKKVFFRIT